MKEETLKWLKNAGWHENRKIDTTENIELLKEKDYEVFEAVKKFMEEFGELVIVTEEDDDGELYQTQHTTVFSKVVGIHKSKYCMDKYAGEKTIPVAIIDNGEIDIFISETGKFYTDRGLIAINTDELWDHILSDGGYMIEWKDLDK